MKTPERLKKIASTVDGRQSGLVVVMEDMEDPHNAMAFVRSCDAFGVQQAHFVFKNTRSFTPRKYGPASATANKWLDYTAWETTEECLNYLKGEGYHLIATVLSDKAESIFDVTFNQEKIAILIGNERDGLSEVAQKMADQHVSIPMRGMVQSLNVSVAGALMLFEVTRQRMPHMERYGLSEAARGALMEEFKKR